MRGKETTLVISDTPSGITPACAGKSGCRWCSRSRSKDHPRACGEKRSKFIRKQDVKGSPPRMRGKVGAQIHLGLLVGITPACAGKSGKRLHPQAPEKDHPRVCGEKSLESLRRSPPEDHPRVCGEKRHLSSISDFVIGSPPRVRGKVRVQAPVQEHRGITPDCAGKSGRESGTRACCRDHPRVCGEKYGRKTAMAFQYGITPACAGKSRLSGCPGSAWWDHPRVCGEKLGVV